MKPMLLLATLLTTTLTIWATNPSNGPKVLVVTAHPDDETGMAVTIYKITHELKGTVDQCVITNGEGGYKYSTLSEDYYGLELTDEKVGRKHLPQIRKQELMNAGKIIGITNHFFLDQKDAGYSLNEKEPLDTTWNVAWVNTRLSEILKTGAYEYVFCLIPINETHAHHKAATLLALRAVQAMPANNRPIVLACTVASVGDTSSLTFSQLKNYTETKIEKGVPLFRVDRTTPFGFKNKLNYKMIANWEIAEHKSQGTMQLAMNMGDYEDFWYFSINGTEGVAKCKELFERLSICPYPSKTY